MIRAEHFYLSLKEMGLGIIHEVNLYNSKGMTMNLNNARSHQTSAPVSQVCSDMSGSMNSGCASRISIYLVLRVALGSPQDGNTSTVTCMCHSVMKQEIKSSSSYISHGHGADSWCS